MVLLYDGEVVERVPREPHDRPVDAVVTPSGVRRFVARTPGPDGLASTRAWRPVRRWRGAAAGQGFSTRVSVVESSTAFSE
ncbi:hypothetical protein STENM327S_03663 [Streptomyces tendae]